MSLKPCPFCWSVDLMVRAREFDPSYTRYRVSCGQCGTQGPIAIGLAEAITAWNTRTPQGET